MNSMYMQDCMQYILNNEYYLKMSIQEPCKYSPFLSWEERKNRLLFASE